MGRRDDLEQLILDSYGLIRDHQQIIQVSDRPGEKLRSTRQIERQWALIEEYLREYVDLWQSRPWSVSDVVVEIAASFPELANVFRQAPAVLQQTAALYVPEVSARAQPDSESAVAAVETGSWREGLMGGQPDVVAHIGSNARLLAGPGTGKTFCLARRIEYLISEQGISPEEIVALTFTRAAAAELRNRVQERLGLEGDEGPRITTLHSFALR